MSNREQDAREVYLDRCEVEERAQTRMVCPQCGAVDGMQAYVASAVLAHGNHGRTTFYYLESDTDEDDALYAPCQVCGVAYERGVPEEYKVYR